MWRGDLTARKVLAYIDGLPSYSAFIEASAQDDEVAQMYASEIADGPTSPRITEWTPERAELVKVNESIQNLIAMVSSALGGKPEQPKPEPRPETARDRLEAKALEDGYQLLLDQIEAAQTREGGDPL